MVTENNYKPGSEADKARLLCKNLRIGIQKVGKKRKSYWNAMKKEDTDREEELVEIISAPEIRIGTLQIEQKEKKEAAEKARQQAILDKIESIREVTTKNIAAAGTEEEISKIIDLIVKTDFEKQDLAEFLKDGEAMGLKMLQLATKKRDEIIAEKEKEEALKNRPADEDELPTSLREKQKTAQREASSAKLSEAGATSSKEDVDATGVLDTPDEPVEEPPPRIFLRDQVAELIFNEEKTRNGALESKKWNIVATDAVSATMSQEQKDSFYKTADKVIELVTKNQ